MEEPKARMAMIYAHRDRDFLQKSELLGFLQGLARQEAWEFWWDENLDHPLFDEEIKRRLNEADIIVCLVSQAFLNSEYVTNVESKLANKRLRDEGILVVPILLSPSRWQSEEWLKDINHFPTKTDEYLRSSRSKGEILLAITDHISASYHRRAQPFRDPKMVYKLRRLPETSLSKEQVRILTKNSCTRARKMVPDADRRGRIAQAAKVLREKNKGNPLSKRQLEVLDKRFLANASRKPDAEIVRWVLRCEGIHPQGRVAERRK